MTTSLNDQNLIQILGIASLPDERKLALLEKASALVEKRLILRLLNSLSEDKRREFENIMDSENQEAVGLFMEQNAPELASWMEEEIGRIKQELAGLTASL